MRSISVLSPQDSIPVQPDTILPFLLAAGTAQAVDWPNSTIAGSSGRPDVVRLSGVTTGGAMLIFHANLNSTKAGTPSTASSTEGSTSFGPTIVGQGTFQITGGSTGMSVASQSSGYVLVECWKRGG